MIRFFAISVFWLAASGQAAPPSIPSPQRSGVLCVRGNISESVPANYLANLSSEVLITDLTYQNDAAKSPIPSQMPIKSFSEARTILQRKCPAALIGCYCSSRQVADKQLPDQEPHVLLDRSLFDDSELLADSFSGSAGRIVDYRQPAARRKLVQAIADQMQRYETKLAYTDEWSHDASWPNFIPWAETVIYLRELTAELHSRNIAHIANVAINLNGVPLSDVQSLGKAVDGLTLEMHNYSTPDFLAKAVKAHAALSATGCQAVLLPEWNNDPAQYATTRNYLAGLAMIFDDCYAGSPCFLPVPDWFNWPAKFGPPKGDVRLDGAIAKRNFRHGTIAVNTEKRTVQARIK